MVIVHAISKNVLGASCRVCMISDQHIGVLNAAKEELVGFSPLEHRWCMRKNKVVDKVKALCCAWSEH